MKIILVTKEGLALSCIEKKSRFENYYQRWPTKGILFDNMNLSKGELKDTIEDSWGKGAHYTVSTVIPYDKKTFAQTGCGPNFEGGLISQCTCRHDIRSTWFSLKEWKNNWLAGFTGYGQKSCGTSYLFYLIKVREPFESFKDIFDYYLHMDKRIIEAKRTDKNPIGDLYYPKRNLKNKHDVDSYLESHEYHSHKDSKNRLKDINYPEYTRCYKKRIIDKHPSLLLGDVKNSYLWSKPEIIYKGGKAPRHKPWNNIESFLKMLEPAPKRDLPVKDIRKFRQC